MVPRTQQGRGLSARAVVAMRELAARSGHAGVIAPRAPQLEETLPARAG